MQDEPLMLRRKRKYESEGPAAKHATMWASGDAAAISCDPGMRRTVRAVLLVHVGAPGVNLGRRS